MKRNFLFLACVIISNVLISQERLEKGSKNSLEAGINLQSVPTLTPMLRYRYFVSNRVSLRAGMELSVFTNKAYFFEEEAGNTGLEGIMTRKNTSTVLHLGFAYHLKGNDRLSPYFGVDFLGGIGFSEDFGTNTDGNVFVNDYEVVKTSRNTQFGGNMFFGMDYHCYKNVFIGFEAGMILSVKNYSGVNEALTISGVTVNTYENDYSTLNLNQSGFLVRAGFKF
jgi:hypothetical protein